MLRLGALPEIPFRHSFSYSKWQIQQGRFLTHSKVGNILPTPLLTVAVRLMPPLSFFLKPILGGLLFKRIPKPSNSLSIIFLCPKGFRTSRTIRIRLQVRATVEKKGGGVKSENIFCQVSSKKPNNWNLNNNGKFHSRIIS